MNTTTINNTLKSAALGLALFAAAAQAQHGVRPTNGGMTNHNQNGNRPQNTNRPAAGNTNRPQNGNRPQAGNNNPNRKIVDVWPGNRPQNGNRPQAGNRPQNGGRPPVVVDRRPPVVVRNTGGRPPVVVDRRPPVVVRNAGGRPPMVIRDRFTTRPVLVGNSRFVERTYVERGRPMVAMFRPVEFRGMRFDFYRPTRVFSPGFYAWAYNPWARPMVYGWSWARDPWFVRYNTYFTPFRAYNNASMWLTDYLIANELQKAYTGQFNPGPGVITPVVKMQVSDEIRRQIAQERAEQEDNVPSTPAALDGASHTFVVSNEIQAGSDAGNCLLTPGDVIGLTGQVSDDNAFANAVVLAGKAASCRVGSVVSVSTQDAQEMQNDMRNVVNQGLAEMQARQTQQMASL